MDEKKKPEGMQALCDEHLDEATGGSSFDNWIVYRCRCRDCGCDRETVFEKPNRCERCGSPNIDVQQTLKR